MEKIKIYVQNQNYFIFDVQSIATLESLHIKASLIGPCPRQLTSDKTSFPALLNKFQLELLLDQMKNERLEIIFYDSNSENVKNDSKIKETILRVIDMRVTKRHAQIALSHGQTQARHHHVINDPTNQNEDPRWIINFLNSEKTKTIIPKSLLTKYDRQLYLIYRHLWSAGFWITSGLKYGSDWLAYRGTPKLYHSEFIVKYVDYDLPLPVSQITSLCRIGSKTNKVLLLASVQSDDRPITSMVTWSTRASNSSHT